MKPKISREEFLKLKEELIKLCKQAEDISNEDIPEFDRNAENYQELRDAYYEELERKEKEWAIKYKENIEQLTSYNLSEIPSDDWEDITIYAYKEGIAGVSITADFSETFANLDFAVINFIGDNFDFHSCRIFNIDNPQEDMQVSRDAFDIETIEENNDYFISEDLPEDVKDRFYSKKITLEDIVTYEEIFLKAKHHMGYPYNQGFYEDLGETSYEEIKKIDLELIRIISDNITPLELSKIVKGEKFSAESFNKEITNIIRKYIIDDGYRYLNDGIYPESFRKNNPDLIYYEEMPELFNNNDPQRLKTIDLDLMYEYKDVLKGKKYKPNFEIQAFLEKVGEDFLEIIPQEFEKQQIKGLMKFFTSITSRVSPNEKSERISKKLLELPLEEKVDLLRKLHQNNFGKIDENLDEALDLLKIMDISDMDFFGYGELDSKIKEQGLDKFVYNGYSKLSDVNNVYNTRDFKEIKEYIEHIGINIDFFVGTSSHKDTTNAIKKHGIDFYIEQGWNSIEDTARHRKSGVSLEKAKELIEKGIELDAVFDDNNIVEFINTLGIDNILRFHKESKEFFYFGVNGSNDVVVPNNNLPTFAKIFTALRAIGGNEKINNDISYEEFIEEITKIILTARKNRIFVDTIESVSEDVKKKIPEEFLSKDELDKVWPTPKDEQMMKVLSGKDDIVRNFKLGTLTSETIRKYPQIIPVLKNKNLPNSIKINGKKKTQENTLYDINIVQYISEKFGNDIMLDLCRKYGKFLDKSILAITGEENLEELLEKVDKEIYRIIKIQEMDIIPHDNIDEEFKIKHPELYLDYNVEEEIKEKFYKKELGMEDLKNPKVREALIGKNMQVGFDNYFSLHDGIKKLYRDLTLEGFYELIDTYGRYLEDCEIENFEPMIDNNHREVIDRLKEKIEKTIEQRVLERKVYIDDDAPKFLKEKYPQYFIDGLNKEDRDIYYAFQGKATFKRFYETFQGDKLKAFEGKDISINFPNAKITYSGIFSTPYEEFFEKFSMEQILGSFSKYGANLDKIIASNKIDIFKKVYEKHGEIALQATELILQIKEEDIEKINISNYLNLLKKSNFNLDDNARFGEGRVNAERLVAKMYIFLGYDNTAEIFKLPEMSKEELARLIEEKEAEFDEACEVRFTLKNDIQIVTEMFRKLNLAKYQNGNKKIQFDIYKNINMNLENGFNGNLEELIEASIIGANINPNKEEITELGKYLNSILTMQKMEKLNSYINSSIDLDLTATGPNRKIITDTLLTEIRKNLLKNSNINKEELLQGLKKEILEKSREDGTPYYSPQVRNHFNEIEKIIENLLKNQEVIQISSKTTIDSIKAEREKIGNGWIRKVLNVPNDLSLEEIENLEQKLYGIEENGKNIEYEKRVIVKNKENSINAEEKAYTLFKELNNPLILTMSKAEFIFDRIQEPYSKEFITFFMANRKEILEDPNLYTKIPQLHAIFDEIIQSKEVRNRYDKGLITVNQMFEFITNNDRPYGTEQEGDWELSGISRASSLDARKFKIAQEILAKMKEREFQTVPPVKNKAQGKYRGRILRSDDPLHLVIGDLTTCCQHIGGYGETSMLHSALEKNGSLFIVEELDEFGNVVNIVAQSWTWRNNDTVCFDNIEIPDTLGHKFSKQDYEDITKIYQETAKSIILADVKMLKKLLDEGKITKEQYDRLVIKEVTVGTGCNDLETLDEKGRFESSKKGVLPVENGKTYPESRDPLGDGKLSLYTDASHSYIFAKITDVQDKIEQMPELSVKTEHIKDELVNIPIGYGKSREILSHKGKQINPDDIRIMEKIAKNSSSDYYEFEGAETKEDIASDLGVEINGLRLLISRDEDWYMLSSEDSKYIKIESAAKVVTEDKEGELTLESKIAGLEMVSNIYDLMLEADKKDKEIIISSENDLSGINLEVLEEKGFIIIAKDSRKNIIKVNSREKLEEESKKIKEMLESKEELLMIQGKLKNKEEQDGEEKATTEEIR